MTRRVVVTVTETHVLEVEADTDAQALRMVTGDPTDLLDRTTLVERDWTVEVAEEPVSVGA